MRRGNKDIPRKKQAQLSRARARNAARQVAGWQWAFDVYFWTYIFIAFLILLNILLAILVDAYATVKAETAEAQGLPEDVGDIALYAAKLLTMGRDRFMTDRAVLEGLEVSCSQPRHPRALFLNHFTLVLALDHVALARALCLSHFTLALSVARTRAVKRLNPTLRGRRHSSPTRSRPWSASAPRHAPAPPAPRRCAARRPRGVARCGATQPETLNFQP